MLTVPRAGKPKGTWGIGSSNVRYVDKRDENEEFIQELRQFLKDPDTYSLSENPISKKGQSDQNLKVQVERAAIDYVKAHYRGFKCTNVETENKGWDLEFRRGCVRLLVEVKGCSGKSAKVELTPNEYGAMCRRKDKFRLAIVTSALVEPRLSIIKFNDSDKTWRDQHDKKFKLTERKGARVWRALRTDSVR